MCQALFQGLGIASGNKPEKASAPMEASVLSRGQRIKTIIS